MIIHPLTPTRENGELRIAAQIELKKSSRSLPKTLWFRFPEAQTSFLNDRADVFALALVFLALELGEDIHVRGTLSPRLVYGLQEFQRKVFGEATNSSPRPRDELGKEKIIEIVPHGTALTVSHFPFPAPSPRSTFRCMDPTANRLRRVPLQ